jgi:periplasmic divalent cation tolerance protein
MANGVPRRRGWGRRVREASPEPPRNEAGKYTTVTSATGYFQVTTTLPDRGAAERLASMLVEERLAACAQIVGPVGSTYRWKGSVEQATEWYCHLKTTLARAPALRSRVRELHPYETPEIVAVPIVDGDPSYLKWIAASVAEPEE